MTTNSGAENVLSLKGRRVDIPELVNEASIAVIKAMPGYDPNKGAFSTYMMPRMAAAMYNCGIENSSLVHVPREVKTTAMKIVRESDNRHQAMNNIAESFPMNREIDMPAVSVGSVIYFSISGTYAGIDAYIDENGHSPRTYDSVFLRDADADRRIEWRYERRELSDVTKAALSMLKSEHRDLLLRIYMDGEKPSQVWKSGSYPGKKCGRTGIDSRHKAALGHLRRT